jgi:malonyl CoA-acyl carrier protein transacylase/NAD(P)-dependent dehydrogenase (short-subunit alcohol dehydrogenase family)
LGCNTPACYRNWPGELLLWKGHSRQELLEAIHPLERALASGAEPDLADLAFSVNRSSHQKEQKAADPLLTLALVVSSLEDLKQKMELGRAALKGSETTVWDIRGIYFSEQPLARKGKIAFLFPGQGSQYVNMLSGLAIAFPEIREQFEKSDAILTEKLVEPLPLSRFIFPPPAFTDEEKLASARTLAKTYIAQPAVGTASLALFHLLKRLGISPHMAAGHSYGEYVALGVAGALSEHDLILLSEARGRFIVNTGGPEKGAMAAVNAGAELVRETIQDTDGLFLANMNAPKQSVISGFDSAVKRAVERFRREGIQAVPIPVSCAFHSPIISKASESLKQFLSGLRVKAPQVAVFSNTTTGLYPTQPEAIARQLVQHLCSPVDFIGEIEAMYAEGARVFVEVGPGRVLTGLVGQILGEREHLAIPCVLRGQSELVQLLHLLAQMAAHGVSVQLDRLYRGRRLEQIDFTKLKAKPPYSDSPPSAWLVNGFRAKPLGRLPLSAPEKTLKPLEIQTDPPEPRNHRPDRRRAEADTSLHGSVSRAPDGPPAFFPPDGQPPPRDKFQPSGHGNAAIMTSYQRLMNAFLETQKKVMMGYLQSTSRPGKSLPYENEQGHENRILAAASTGSTQTSAGFERPPEPPAIPPAQHAPGAQTLSGPKGPEENPDPLTVNLESCLLKIVSDRTGYPVEMLDLDVDLEAELGIDSIKRIEILGGFIQVAAPHRERLEKEMEGLVGMKKLRDLLERLQACIRPEPSAPDQETASQRDIPEDQKRPEAPLESHGRVERFTLATVSSPSTVSPLPVGQQGVMVITDDERGVARDLADRLQKQHQKTVLVQCYSTVEESGDGFFKAPVDSPDGCAELMDRIRQKHGPITGLIHLLPLKKEIPFELLVISQWKERLRKEIKSLFYMIKELETDLLHAAKREGSCIVAATGMGGRFASEPSGDAASFSPSHGGIGGLLKTLAIEWPDVRIKAVDLNLEESPHDLASHLLTEMNLNQHQTEVGYDGSRRLTLLPKPAPLQLGESKRLDIKPSWVILVTGGARGITATVALKLARTYQPNLILVGRSPLPSEKESPQTLGLQTDKEIKAALISQMRAASQPFALSEVEAAYRQLLKEREIRRNLLEMKNTGATVHYFQGDVRDEQAFGSLIDQIYSTYGRLDGVIHGAGVIEDKLIKDKTIESFDRVFDTKVVSGFILARKLRPETLKFFVFFSSVAGRFGNRGQGDYAAANEVINKLALHLDRHWPGRILAISWGPWAGSGMVTPALEKEFARRGIGLIARDLGPRILDHELCYGQKGDVEIIVGDVEDWQKQKHFGGF